MTTKSNLSAADYPGNFGRTLAAMIARRNVSLIEAGKMAGADGTTMHRLLKGQRPTGLTLYLMIHRFATDEAEQMEFMRAHILDEIELARMTGKYVMTLVDPKQIGTGSVQEHGAPYAAGIREQSVNQALVMIEQFAKRIESECAMVRQSAGIASK